MINEKKVNDIQYQILKELDRICKKNNIKYFLTGGSLLGACRYGRIIKGDKDIDVGIIRTDYQKFIRICSEKLNNKYELICMENTKNYYWPFAKIQYKNSALIPKNKLKTNIFKIYIDVCPYDYVPINNIARKIYINKIKYYKWLLILKDKNYKPTKNAIKPLRMVSRLYTRKKLIHKLSYTLQKESTVVQNIVGGTKDDWYYLDDLNNLKNKPFGINNYPCPKYTRYLKDNYGDYESGDITRNELYSYDVKIWSNTDGE